MDTLYPFADHLETLVLNTNKITNFSTPKDVVFGRLQELDLGGNELAAFDPRPNVRTAMPALVKLWLQDNCLAEVPPGISDSNAGEGKFAYYYH